MPSVTIIIATVDRAPHLQATVHQLTRQSFADFDLWVVDQSRPDQAESNRRYIEQLADARLHHLRLDTRSLPNARNEGLVRATGEIILFVDDDVILLSDEFIGAHVDCYADPAVGGVTGRHVERFIRENSRTTACYVSRGGRTIYNLFGTERQPIGSCKGSNMSYRMAAVHQVGGFDRRTHMLEDTDFSVRIAQAGWALLFEPAAEVIHLSAPSGGVREPPGLSTECRRFRSTAYYVAKHRGWFGIACFLATFALIGLKKAVRFRSLTAIPTLIRATAAGLNDARLPRDQALLPLGSSPAGREL